MLTSACACVFVCAHCCSNARNMIVHDSLYNYIYVDCLNHLHLPQGVCFFLTFFISAVVHEYIISLALKFFYPVLLVMFLGFGVFFVYLTRFLGTSGRAWNIFFWSVKNECRSVSGT